MSKASPQRAALQQASHLLRKVFDGLGVQTGEALRSWLRVERQLADSYNHWVRADDEPLEKVVLLSYRPGLEEPGPEKSFELSAGALAQRWRAGVLEMEYSDRSHPSGEVLFVRRA